MFNFCPLLEYDIIVKGKCMKWLRNVISLGAAITDEPGPSHQHQEMPEVPAHQSPAKMKLKAEIQKLRMARHRAHQKILQLERLGHTEQVVVVCFSDTIMLY